MNKTERLTALYTLAAAVEENEDEIADELRKTLFGSAGERKPKKIKVDIIYRNICIFKHKDGSEMRFEGLTSAAEFFGTDVQTINSRLYRESVVDGWKGKRVPNPEFPQWLKCRWLPRDVAKRILEEGENE